MLTRDNILNLDDRRTHKIAVPEWGGDLYLRRLSGAERGRWQALCARVKDEPELLEGLAGRFLTMALGDEKGDRIFSDADADALNKRDGQVLERIVELAYAFNGIGDGSIEDAEKN